jgi:hypothetical protein
MDILGWLHILAIMTTATVNKEVYLSILYIRRMDCRRSQKVIIGQRNTHTFQETSACTW